MKEQVKSKEQLRNEIDQLKRMATCPYQTVWVPPSEIVEKSDNLISQGGFGSVYRFTKENVNWAQKLIIKKFNFKNQNEFSDFALLILSIFKEMKNQEKVSAIDSDYFLKLRGISLDLNPEGLLKFAIFTDLIS